MGLKLDRVVPWGRSLSEYQGMFNLSAADLNRSILDCGGGPASFNAEMTRLGHRVVSCDPIYQFSVNAIEQRIQDTYPQILEGVRAHAECYVWEQIQSPEQLGEVRMAAMRQFLADFPAGLRTQRYINQALPSLDFANQAFDLALCSHLLFTYSDHLSLEFHLASIRELCRVAAEVRIFPLLNLAGDASAFLPAAIAALSQQGYRLEIQTVPYEFQRGGNQLLQIRL